MLKSALSLKTLAVISWNVSAIPFTGWTQAHACRDSSESRNQEQLNHSSPEVSLNPSANCPESWFGEVVAVFIKPHESAGKPATGSQAIPYRGELILLHNLDVPWDHRLDNSRGRAQISSWISPLKVAVPLRICSSFLTSPQTQKLSRLSETFCPSNSFKDTTANLGEARPP